MRLPPIEAPCPPWSSVARGKRRQVDGLDDISHLVRRFVHDGRASGPLVGWKNRPLDGLADADGFRERRDCFPAPSRLVAEDDDPGALIASGIHDRVECVATVLSPQPPDVVLVSDGEEQTQATPHALPVA